MVADRHHPLALLGLFAFGLFAGPAAAESVPWTASLSSKDVVPPTNSAGKGQLDAVYDTVSKEFKWTLTYSGLSGPVTSVNFHGPAEQGKEGPILFPAGPATASPIKGSLQLSIPQADALKRGVYVEIQTSKFPGGEIRGELK
ncbi:CHRD domain-containing protein [Alsobacter sp. KACC 23698]|uniref:CHRD domain-containing protein n=1 Tax=Alsobacter sp. KACC 23698 TaxID=3149229 RepID=A0AAU7JNK4_9HYPH